MNTLVYSEETEKYYLTDELVASLLAEGEQDDTFFGYLSNEDRKCIGGLIEIKPAGDWQVIDLEEDDWD